MRPTTDYGAVQPHIALALSRFALLAQDLIRGFVGVEDVAFERPRFHRVINRR
jgi:hypothetical protein